MKTTALLLASAVGEPTCQVVSRDALRDDRDSITAFAGLSAAF